MDGSAPEALGLLGLWSFPKPAEHHGTLLRSMSGFPDSGGKIRLSVEVLTVDTAAHILKVRAPHRYIVRTFAPPG